MIEISPVGERKPSHDVGNRFIGLGKILGGFFHAKLHTVVVQTHACIFFYDPIQVVAAVI